MPYRFDDFYKNRNPRAKTRRPDRKRDVERSSLVLRVDEYHDVYDRDEDGNKRVDPATGRYMSKTVALWGTSLCSGEKVHMVLADEEEMRADGFGKIPARRDVQTIRDAFPDMRNPHELPEERRPVMRCDCSSFIRDEEGRLKAAVYILRGGDTIVHARMRCGWMKPYTVFRLASGEEVFPQEHMECARFSTVNFHLASRNREGEGFDYYRLFDESLKRSLDNGVTSYAKACSNASFELLKAWQEERKRDPGTRMGSLSVTTWHPDECLRFSLSDRDGKGQKALEKLFSSDCFQPQTYVDREGKTHVARPRAMPELVLRFLNDRGEVCGVYRMRAGELANIARLADRIGKTPPQGTSVAAGPGDDVSGTAPRSFWDTPGGKAAFVVDEMVKGLDTNFVAANGITQVDLLPGRCHPVDRRLAQGLDVNGRESRAARYQLRNLVFLGLVQGRAPEGVMRQNIGCAQAFVPRTPADRVVGWYNVRDGSSYHNACMLLADGRRLYPSDDYSVELEREFQYLNDLGQYFELAEEARKGLEEAAGASRDDPGRDLASADATSDAASDATLDRIFLEDAAESLDFQGFPDLPERSDEPADGLPWEADDEDAGPRP